MAFASRFDPINRVSYLELRTYMANTLLRDADCMGMAHGLEIRVPFLDHELVRFMFTIPGARSSTGECGSRSWRQPAHGLLPDTIARRPKRGFTLPFAHWLKGELRLEVESAFVDHSSPIAGIINPAAMEQVWRDFQAGRTSWSRPWSLFVLRRWCELNLSTQVPKVDYRIRSKMPSNFCARRKGSGRISRASSCASPETNSERA